MIETAVNYVAISEALGVSPSVLAAGVAADNIISALYFMTLFSLAAKIQAEPKTAPGTYGDSICIYHLNFLAYKAN